MELSTSLEFLIMFLVGSFAAFRAARMVTKDKFSESARDWLVVKLVQNPEGGLRESGIRASLAYLVACTVCVGVWAALLVTSALCGCWPWQIGLDGAVLWLSIAGGQLTLQEWLYGRR